MGVVVIPSGALMRRILELLAADHLLAVYSSIAEACEPLAGPRHPMSS